MKEIQPVQLWVNGFLMEATQFSLIIVNDNLTDSAIFYYRLLNPFLVKLAEGNLNIIDPDYAIWGTNEDINLAAYQWAATQLNIVLI